MTNLTTLEKVYVMSTIFDTVETFSVEKREDEDNAIIELLNLVNKLGDVAEA